MNPAPTKGTMVCNHKWLNRMSNFYYFSETNDIGQTREIHIILLTRNPSFLEKLRTSRRRFKKISAENLNMYENFCWKKCIRKMSLKTPQKDFHVMFINEALPPHQVIKNVNTMIKGIANYYHCEKGVFARSSKEHNKDTLIDLWTLILSNVLDDEYIQNFNLKLEEKLDVL